MTPHKDDVCTLCNRFRLVPVLLLALSLSACSSIPKVKDFNEIGMGMTKDQVIDELGQPKSTNGANGKEFLEYDAKDDGGVKARLVVLQDNEVIFFGRPSDYKEQAAVQAQTVQPVFNNNNTVNVNGSGAISEPKAVSRSEKEKKVVDFVPAAGSKEEE